MHRGRLSRGLAKNKPGGVTFLGTNSNKVYRYKQQHFYAQRGYIRVHDQRDGDYKIVSCQDFLLRAKNFSNSAKKAQDPKEKHDLLNMVDDMMKCVKEARHQGDPNAPGVMRQMKHDNRYMGIICPGIATTELPSRK